jgi:hypothetical protein
MQYTLSTFQVRLADIDNEPIWFTCQAEDKEHAQEQAENAYPGYVLVSVKRLPQIKAGSTVWWTDPDNGFSSGRYQVLKVLTENGFLPAKWVPRPTELKPLPTASSGVR